MEWAFSVYTVGAPSLFQTYMGEGLLAVTWAAGLRTASVCLRAGRPFADISTHLVLNSSLLLYEGIQPGTYSAT